jgi:hypothetical protein
VKKAFLELSDGVMDDFFWNTNFQKK